MGLVFSTLIISGCGSKTVSNEAERENNIYKEYYDIVSNVNLRQWDGFALIDLDGDGVCELFATCLEGDREDASIQPYMIVGNDHNGEVVMNDELQDGVAGVGGYRGTLYYVEGKGLLHENMSFAPLGLPADTIYVFRDGKIEVSDMGEFTVDNYDGAEEEDWNPLEHGVWTWNGETIAEDKYFEKLQEVMDGTEGVPLCEIEWKSKDTILESLSK